MTKRLRTEKPEEQRTKQIVDAIRESLGMRPLYGPQQETSYVTEGCSLRELVFAGHNARRRAN